MCLAIGCVYDHRVIHFSIIYTDPPENTNLTTIANTSATLRNSNVTFTCTAEGSPPPHEYRFYHKGTFLGNSSSGTFQTHVTKSGLSVFSCVPVNKAGLGENRSVTIDVVGEIFFNSQEHFICFYMFLKQSYSTIVWLFIIQAKRFLKS